MRWSNIPDAPSDGITRQESRGAWQRKVDEEARTRRLRAQKERLKEDTARCLKEGAVCPILVKH